MKKSKSYPPGKYPNGQHPARGEIYWCEHPDPQDEEMPKRRPWLVVSTDQINKKRGVHVMAAISSQVASRPLKEIVDFAGIPPLLGPGTILLGQLFTFSRSRIGNYIGKLSADELKSIETALNYVLSGRR